jgi:hypothetical protein
MTTSQKDSNILETDPEVVVSGQLSSLPITKPNRSAYETDTNLQNIVQEQRKEIEQLEDRSLGDKLRISNLIDAKLKQDKGPEGFGSGLINLIENLYKGEGDFGKDLATLWDIGEKKAEKLATILGKSTKIGNPYPEDVSMGLSMNISLLDRVRNSEKVEGMYEINFYRKISMFGQRAYHYTSGGVFNSHTIYSSVKRPVNYCVDRLWLYDGTAADLDIKTSTKLSVMRRTKQCGGVGCYKKVLPRGLKKKNLEKSPPIGSEEVNDNFGLLYSPHRVVALADERHVIIHGKHEYKILNYSCGKCKMSFKDMESIGQHVRTKCLDGLNIQLMSGGSLGNFSLIGDGEAEYREENYTGFVKYKIGFTDTSRFSDKMPDYIRHRSKKKETKLVSSNIELPASSVPSIVTVVQSGDDPEVPQPIHDIWFCHPDANTLCIGTSIWRDKKQTVSRWTYAGTFDTVIKALDGDNLSSISNIIRVNDMTFSGGVLLYLGHVIRNLMRNLNDFSFAKQFVRLMFMASAGAIGIGQAQTHMLLNKYRTAIPTKVTMIKGDSYWYLSRDHTLVQPVLLAWRCTLLQLISACKQGGLGTCTTNTWNETTVICPVTQALCSSPKKLMYWLFCWMEWPWRELRTTENLYCREDYNGGNVAVDPAESSEILVSTYTRVPGPHTRVLFVLCDIPVESDLDCGGGVIVNAGPDGVGVDIAGRVDNYWGDFPNDTNEVMDLVRYFEMAYLSAGEIRSLESLITETSFLCFFNASKQWKNSTTHYEVVGMEDNRGAGSSAPVSWDIFDDLSAADWMMQHLPAYTATTPLGMFTQSIDLTRQGVATHFILPDNAWLSLLCLSGLVRPSTEHNVLMANADDLVFVFEEKATRMAVAIDLMEQRLGKSLFSYLKEKQINRAANRVRCINRLVTKVLQTDSDCYWCLNPQAQNSISVDLTIHTYDNYIHWLQGLWSRMGVCELQTVRKLNMNGINELVDFGKDSARNIRAISSGGVTFGFKKPAVPAMREEDERVSELFKYEDPAAIVQAASVLDGLLYPNAADVRAGVPIEAMIVYNRVGNMYGFGNNPVVGLKGAPYFSLCVGLTRLGRNIGAGLLSRLDFKFAPYSQINHSGRFVDSNTTWFGKHNVFEPALTTGDNFEEELTEEEYNYLWVGAPPIVKEE